VTGSSHTSDPPVTNTGGCHPSHIAWTEKCQFAPCPISSSSQADQPSPRVPVATGPSPTGYDRSQRPKLNEISTYIGRTPKTQKRTGERFDIPKKEAMSRRKWKPLSPAAQEKHNQQRRVWRTALKITGPGPLGFPVWMNSRPRTEDNRLDYEITHMFTPLKDHEKLPTNGRTSCHHEKRTLLGMPLTKGKNPSPGDDGVTIAKVNPTAVAAINHR